MTADGAPPMRRVDIVVFDGMTLLDATGPLEVLRVADPSGELYCTRLVSAAGGRVRSSAGLEVLTESPSAEGAADTVIVAGGDRLVAEPIEDELLQLAGDLAQNARRVASVCTGAFVLARLGLLDGRRVTTHWRHAQALADRFPLLDVQPDVIHVRDGRIATSAGISAGLDLTLALVEEDLGAAVAREAARELVVFMQRPGGQAQFSSALRQATVGDAGLQTVMGEVLEHPERSHSVASMAERLGVSSRQLHRLVRAQTGLSPMQWLEAARVDAAREIIHSDMPLTSVARRAGFGSDETMRRAFLRQLGVTPSGFRERFTSTGP